MSTIQDNPCLKCNENQRCCSQLSGLRLSKEEFENNFLNLRDKLSIAKDNKIFIVSAIDNGPCPHWEISGCRIYNERPIDCRVYPYEIIGLAEKKRVIEIKYRDSPSCPQKDHLLMPRAEVEALMKALGEKAYGQSKPIVIKYLEEKKDQSRIFYVLNPLMTMVSNVLKRLRKF